MHQSMRELVSYPQIHNGIIAAPDHGSKTHLRVVEYMRWIVLFTTVLAPFELADR